MHQCAKCIIFINIYVLKEKRQFLKTNGVKSLPQTHISKSTLSLQFSVINLRYLKLWKNDLSYQRSASSTCKDIGIWTFEFVAKTECPSRSEFKLKIKFLTWV